MKKCPMCAEEIQDEAIKCKHCGADQSYATDKFEDELVKSMGIKEPKMISLKMRLMWVAFVLLAGIGYYGYKTYAGMSVEDVAEIAKKELQKQLLIQQGYEGITINGLTLIKESRKQYVGLLELKYKDIHEKVNISVKTDGEQMLFQTDPPIQINLYKMNEQPLVADVVVNEQNAQIEEVLESSEPDKASESEEVFICNTEKNRVIIKKSDVNEKFVYLAWTLPYSVGDKNSLIIDNGDEAIEGSGVCRHRYWQFKNGEYGYEVSELGCTEGDEPENSKGKLTVTKSGEIITSKYCMNI